MEEEAKEAVAAEQRKAAKREPVADDDDDDILVASPAKAGGASEGEDGEEDGEEGGEEKYEVSSIRARRVVIGEDGAECQEYLVRWVGYTCDDDTWEPKENLEGLEVFAEFEERRARQMAAEGQDKTKGGGASKAKPKSFIR